MTGGAVTLTAASGSLQANSDFNFSGGTIDFTSASGTSTAALNLRGGTGTGITYSASGTSAAQITNSGAGSAKVSLNTAGTTVFNIADAPSVAIEMSIAPSITGNTALQKTGAGVLSLSGASSYSGATTINGGTLSLDNNNTTTARLVNTSVVTVNSGGTLLFSQSGVTASTDRINDTASITINGDGTFKTGGLSEGIRPSSSVMNDGVAGMGALSLQNTSSASRATIDFLTGANGSSLVFSSLSGGAGAFLDIKNWTGTLFTDNSATANDRLLFGTDPGLSAAQLANVRFFDDNGAFIGPGGIIPYGNMFELTCIPEPSTWLAGGLAFGVLVFSQKRRLLRAISRR